MLASLTMVISFWLLLAPNLVCKAENKGTPIIGILLMEKPSENSKNYKDIFDYSKKCSDLSDYSKKYAAWVPASFVKFIAGSGGRSVPIFLEQPRSYYEDLLNSLNGVLFPGGSPGYWNTYGYGGAANYIYEIAMEMNDRGTYFPLFGICAGAEVLFYISSNHTEHLTKCQARDLQIPLTFVHGFETSRMYRNAPEKVIDILENENVTSNFHRWCIKPEQIHSPKMNNTWKVLALGRDKNGMEFAATIENVKYPFYGIFHHPEETLYEHIKHKNVLHTANAILYAQYYANFLLSEARKCTNNFTNSTIEQDLLFYNYNTVHTAKEASHMGKQVAFTEIYFFPNNCSL